jgi:hypothetical protein
LKVPALIFISGITFSSICTFGFSISSVLLEGFSNDVFAFALTFSVCALSLDKDEGDMDKFERFSALKE